MRKCLIILMAVLALSCSNIPRGILSEEEITPILVELHLAEAIYTQRFVSENKRINFQEDLYLTILKKHKLDQKTFEASLLYYGKHPDIYKPIYDEVLNRLNEMNVKARARDSIEARKPIAKPIVKDTATVKDTVKAKVIVKTNPKDSLKMLDLKAKANKVIKVQKPVTKQSIKDSVKLIK